MWSHMRALHASRDSARDVCLAAAKRVLGATANHSTPQRYRRKGTIREHDAGGDDAFGYR